MFLINCYFHKACEMKKIDKNKNHRFTIYFYKNGHGTVWPFNKPEIQFRPLQGWQKPALKSIWNYARVAKSSLGFGSQLCRGCKILPEIQFELLPGMQWGKPDSVWISAGCAMKVLAFKSSYPGGVNDAPDSGKPYPTGNIMPEIRLRLYPRGWNLPLNSAETLPRWGTCKQMNRKHQTNKIT